MAIDLKTDLLIQKVLDGDALDERELREFAAALIASPEAAETFVLMRRIGTDAALLAQPAPSAGFADRVMRAVSAAPSPAGARTPRAESSRWRWGASLALATVAGGVALLAPGINLLLESWSQAAAAFDWEGGADALLAPAASGLGALLSASADSGGVAESALWLLICAPALVAGLNYWSARAKV